MSQMIKVTICLTVLLFVAGFLGAMVPPHPKYVSIPSAWQPTKIDMPSRGLNSESKSPAILPDNILVLRVQFGDKTFVDTPGYPDDLAHDTAFFDRWMFHLSDFFSDASHLSYDLDYTIHPEVITLPHAMSYYGSDVPDTIDVNLDGFLSDIMALVDTQINFANYDGLIIFHSGQGQESDINGIRTDEIWSTFLTRKRLQAFYDPENDDYPGLQTNDGAILTNIVIVPEDEYQDYFPNADDDPNGVYLFSIYGVLAHQFGHLLGLPTLFDNDSSNGASQGIGNWGLMGTGVWNASGYVPAQVDPWSRMYLGWEPVITITESMENVPVDYFQDHQPERNRLYKLPISEDEYFLVENRQQNPDGSINPYTNQPSYTFKLLPEGEQDYYDNYPLLPYFNFMENRYGGSEWDFMLPGLGGPIPMGMSMPVDGSGLLIWHIDENVIAQNFTSNFDMNTINAYAPHKGIDIEEADGIQNLDTAVPDQYKYGSPYDAFRNGNNDYFGNSSHNGVLSLPTSESYYGGNSLEIYDISASANQMTFSVEFGWKLSTGYSGENDINACLVDFDGDGETEIFYPMPNGDLFMWKDELLMEGYPLNRMPLPYNYAWDGESFYLPMQQDNLSRMYRLSYSAGEYGPTFTNQSWAAQPVVDTDAVYLAMNDMVDGNGTLYRYDKESELLETLKEFEYPIHTNMMLFRNNLYIPTLQEGTNCIWRLNIGTGEFSSGILDIPADSLVIGMYKAPMLSVNQNGELIVQCANSIYMFHDNLVAPNEESSLKADTTKEQDIYLPVWNFPYVHDMHTTAPLTIADWDINGCLDLIITSDQGLAIIDYSGTRMSPESLSTPASDSLAFNSGAVIADLDGDGSNEILGSFGNNRLNCWEDSYKLKSGFPVSFGERSRNLPLFGMASDGLLYAWSATDNGQIYRKALTNASLDDLDSGWNCEYGNLARHASRDHTSLPNQFQSEKLFVQDEVYIYPNPLKSIYDNKLTLNIMTNRDTYFTVKIFDISGTLIFKQNGIAQKYLRNREVIELPASKLKSGVYIAVVTAQSDSRSIKFAVER